MSWEPIVVTNPPPDNVDTDNYKMRLPDYGGDQDTWGHGINGNFYALDIIIQAISDIADEALPKSGGTMTGDILFATPVEDDPETEDDETQLPCGVGSATLPAAYVHTAEISIHGPGDAELGAWGDDGKITAVDVTITSDSRLKTDIEPFMVRATAALGLKASSFKWKLNGENDVGLIAQDVKVILPWAVSEHKGQLRVSYSKVMLALLATVQEQARQIRALQVVAGA